MNRAANRLVGIVRASAIVSISHHHHNCLLYLTLFGHFPGMSVLIFKEKEWFSVQPWLDAVLKGDLLHYHRAFQQQPGAV
ncbi:unnamed protein product [Sphagnum balticum]